MRSILTGKHLPFASDSNALPFFSLKEEPSKFITYYQSDLSYLEYADMVRPTPRGGGVTSLFMHSALQNLIDDPKTSIIFIFSSESVKDSHISFFIRHMQAYGKLTGLTPDTRNLHFCSLWNVPKLHVPFLTIADNSLYRIADSDKPRGARILRELYMRGRMYANSSF